MTNLYKQARCEYIYILHYVEALTYAEIGRRLGISAGFAQQIGWASEIVISRADRTALLDTWLANHGG